MVETGSRSRIRVLFSFIGPSNLTVGRPFDYEVSLTNERVTDFLLLPSVNWADAGTPAKRARRAEVERPFRTEIQHRTVLSYRRQDGHSAGGSASLYDDLSAPRGLATRFWGAPCPF